MPAGPSHHRHEEREARAALIAEDLAAGRLVKPFDLALAAEWAYYLVYPPRALARPKVAAFRDWLFKEAARHRAPESALPSRAA